MSISCINYLIDSYLRLL